MNETSIDGTTLDLARDGDRASIRRLCEMWIQFANHKPEGRPKDQLSVFLFEAIQAISEGMTPNEAFHWSRQGGRPKANNLYRDLDITLSVIRYMEEGFTEERALEQVLAEPPKKGVYMPDFDGIRKIYRRIRPLLEHSTLVTGLDGKPFESLPDILDSLLHMPD